MKSYRILFRKRATKEYLEAITWYEERSSKAALNFITEINRKLDVLEQDPTRFRFIYKQYKEILVNHYPFCIVYFIDEKLKKVVVTSVFHVKRNPGKKI